MISELSREQLLSQVIACQAMAKHLNQVVMANPQCLVPQLNEDGELVASKASNIGLAMQWARQYKAMARGVTNR